MPSLGADMDKGTVIEWRVRPGDMVSRGDIVAVVQTDKSDIEVETFTAGVVEDILVPAGEEVAVGAVLARLRTPGEPAPPRPTAASVSKPGLEPRPQVSPPSGRGARPPAHGPLIPHGPTVLSPVVRHLAETAGVDLATVTPTGLGGLITRHDVEAAAMRGDVRAHGASPWVAPSPGPLAAEKLAVRPSRPDRRASPRARRVAAAHGVELEQVEGTGPHGSITGSDVERVARQAATLSEPSQSTTGAPQVGAGDRQVALRAAVAKLMVRSKREIPHYYLSTNIDMATALNWLEGQNATRPVTTRLLPAALILKATARAALRVPEMNGYWVDDAFQAQPVVDLGVAVSLRRGGLIAPTIQSAHQLTIDELMDRLRDLVTHARSGSLRSTEMSPPTITVTNLGDEGVEVVFPIIYPPQVAMVGFGKITLRPWAIDGMLGVHPVLTATLAADHRVSDGHRGAGFLNRIDRLLQEPDKL